MTFFLRHDCQLGFRGDNGRMPLAEKSCSIAADSPEIGLRIDRVVQQLCDLPRAQVVGLFDHGCVQLNDAVCSLPGQRIVAGDRLRLKYDASQKYYPKNKPRQHLGFELVFEDRYLLVVNKPAELLTVPTRRGETNTLLDKVTQYVRHVGGARQAFNAHRLDRGVSGLLIFGKTLEISQEIRDQFALHKPEREYAAIVAGVMEQVEGTFESLLATDKNLNRYSTEDTEIGQRAVTHFRVARKLEGATLVTVWLETGRRNQIRVHFAEAGHPVLGDPRYEPELAADPRWPYRRLALHARQLAFDHPKTGKHLRFECPLPAEMQRFLRL